MYLAGREIRLADLQRSLRSCYEDWDIDSQLWSKSGRSAKYLQCTGSCA